MNKFIKLATHILAMQDDAYLTGHPEFMELVKEAKNAINADQRSYKIALLKDNQLNWDMGLLTKEEYEAKINHINSL